ncbi:MAG: cold shock domain-containing protein [Anaerolineae bacterium]|jgi:CspA family cold shock protein
MKGQLDVIVCQRCGRGFVETATYLGFLARWGREVVVPVLCPSCFLAAGPLPKEEGKVKWFSQRKHYGFITIGEDEDVFFHQEQLVEEAEGCPQEGQLARFHMRQSSKGPEALNVEIEGQQ